MRMYASRSSPTFSAPILECRTFNRDQRTAWTVAIYPIPQGSPFWQEIRSEFNNRLVVAEFKNSADAVGQTEVESIQQYLFMKAIRLFGILCSRKPAMENGLKARRRGRTEHSKMILLPSDADLLEMLDMKALREDPTAPLDQHIDAFLTELAP